MAKVNEIKNMSLNNIVKRCHAMAVKKGWWETKRTPLEVHMLISSEVAEASEAVRRRMKPFEYKCDLSYLAGLIDGEGTIGITKAKHYRNGRPYDNYCLRVAVGNTERELVEPFLEFGGKIRACKIYNENARQSFHWQVVGHNAVKFLESILPYLQSPKKYWAAVWALAFMANRIKFGGLGRGNVPDFENRRRNNAFYEMVKIVNAKGTEHCKCLPKIIRKPEGEAVELVDACIRIFDYFGAKGWDLEKVLQAKMAYNRTRSYRHGNKKY